MFLRRIRGFALPSAVAFTAALAACGNDNPTGTGSNASAVVIVSGNGQVGLVGQALTTPLVIRVAAGTTPVQGATVAFAVTAGSATVSPATATTNAAGQATANVTFGSTPGTVTVTATVSANPSLVATFNLTSGSGNLSVACQSAQPTTPTVGAVQAGVAGTGVCLGGGTSGAEYALIAFNSNPDTLTGTNLPLFVRGTGANSVVLADVLPNMNATTTAGSQLIAASPSNAQQAFDLGLRRLAKRELTARARALPPPSRMRPSFAAIPANPAIGSIITLNANGEQACTQIKSRGARVAAVSNTAIIVADTANPSGGFTDAEYQSFAVTFDTLINAVDVQNFGQPSDIDHNGKVVIFFTKEVNLLTPVTANGVIGGFFFERDLFPIGDTSTDFAACPGSNQAEMFYVLVPDPNGVAGKTHTKQDVLEITPGTLAHEYQHLINAGRRMFVNLPFNDFEEVWLNEGLSHVAEELLYYKVSGFAPRQNLSIQTLTTSQALVDAFNNYQGSNSGRFETFLNKPSQTSVYGNNDSLETRGATWHLLRYLADHRGSSDGDTWTQLDNTSLTGHANLERVFGANYMTQIRDWATSVFTDDLTGVTDPHYLEQSWNMRNIFPALCIDSRSPCTKLGKYPLTVVPLSDASPANLTIYSGGAAYLRFAVPSGSQASIDWSAGGLPISPLIQLTLVRTK